VLGGGAHRELATGAGAPALRLPNFFLVGAPKAGTTSLYRYLAQHPQVYMSPVKEPAFFAPDLAEYKRGLGVADAISPEFQAYLDGPLTERRDGVINQWEQYLKLFKNVTSEIAVGEASSNYLGSRSAPVSIHERIPHAKIIMILRDPVDRLFSQYSQAAARGHAAGDFLGWVGEQQINEGLGPETLGAIWNGFYAKHLQRYLAVFPADQIKVVMYEEYSSQPEAVFREVFEFIEVDPSVPIDVVQRHNITLRRRFSALPQPPAEFRTVIKRLLPRRAIDALRAVALRRPPKIAGKERAKALEIYRADLCDLERLLNRNLGSWLNPRPTGGGTHPMNVRLVL
jgi:hypothetical protein